jgi:Ca2+-binding EF-hand superfamily protein
MKSTRLLLAGSIAALLPLAGAFAQTPDPGTPPSQSSQTPDAGTQPAQQQGASFESLDVNGDGKISKAEAAANDSVNAQFSKYDQNGDGFIERSEVNSANGSQSQPNQ